MIINKNKELKYDPNTNWFISYEKDPEGNYTAVMDEPVFGGKEKLIDQLYQTRAKEFALLKEQLLNGEISPIKLFMQNQMLEIKDVALRMKISVSKVKKHLTPEGFTKIDIQTLQKYAKVFGLSIVDFFQFINVDDQVQVRMDPYPNRLIQVLEIRK
jgi:hypothetical protein